MYYLCAENNGTDLRLCFCIQMYMQKADFLMPWLQTESNVNSGHAALIF